MFYGITTNYEYNANHKRDRIDVWSGGFMSDHEAIGYSLPNGNGYIVHRDYDDSIRVQCPTPRNENTYIEIDAAINAAMNEARQNNRSKG